MSVDDVRPRDPPLLPEQGKVVFDPLVPGRLVRQLGCYGHVEDLTDRDGQHCASGHDLHQRVTSGMSFVVDCRGGDAVALRDLADPRPAGREQHSTLAGVLACNVGLRLSSTKRNNDLLLRHGRRLLRPGPFFAGRGAVRLLASEPANQRVDIRGAKPARPAEPDGFGQLAGSDHRPQVRPGDVQFLARLGVGQQLFAYGCLVTHGCNSKHACSGRVKRILLLPYQWGIRSRTRLSYWWLVG